MTSLMKEIDEYDGIEKISMEFNAIIEKFKKRKSLAICKSLN